MAFKTVTDLNADTTISIGGVNKKTGKKNPTSIEGYLLGSREVPDRKKKSGVSFIHVFQTAQGNVGVWGKTDMDRKIGAVSPGTMTRVSFDRMVPTPNGDMYKYKIEFDEDNTVEVPGTPGIAVPRSSVRAASSDDVAAYEGSADDQHSSYSQDEENLDQEEEDEDEDALQAAALAAAERRAKVEALLGKGKTKSAKT